MKVVTFDHRQRGAASTEDAAFVQRLAALYGLECDTHVWEGGKGTADQFRTGGAGRSLRQKATTSRRRTMLMMRRSCSCCGWRGARGSRKLLKVCACGSRPSSGLY